MPVNLKTFVLLILSIAFITILYPRIVERSVNYPVKPFVISSLGGGELVDSALPRDEPVILHFWATWCEVCKFEMPEILRLGTLYPVVNISVHSGNDMEVLSFASHNGIPSDYLANDEVGALMRSFGVIALPTTLVIDKHNRVRFFRTGKVTANEMVDVIENLKVD